MNNKSKKSIHFGKKHLASLIFVMCISILILSFRNYIGTLKNFGYFGVFLTMLLSNATVFLPVPGIVANFLFGATSLHPLGVGIAAGIGSSIGELTGYLAGYSGSDIVTSSKKYQQIKVFVERYGLWTIFVLSLIPNPFFDIGGLAAGAVGISWKKFFVVTLLGKTIRATIIALAGYYSFSG